MLVKDCMTRHPIVVSPTTPAGETQRIMLENRIRHMPVVGDGKRFLGLVTRHHFYLKPDLISSLSIWEFTNYLANLAAKDLMLPAKIVHTIDQERTVERAAKIMADHKIGCLPVLEDDIVVGMLTETDLLGAFQEMLGLPSAGVRVTVRMPDRKGEFVKLMRAMGANQLGVMGVGAYPTRRLPGYYDVVIKIPYVTAEQVSAALSQVEDQEIVDLRESV